MYMVAFFNDWHVYEMAYCNCRSVMLFLYLDIFQVWSCFEDSHVQQEWYVPLDAVSNTRGICVYVLTYIQHVHIHTRTHMRMHARTHTRTDLITNCFYTGQFHALIQFSTVDYAATAKMVTQSMLVLSYIMYIYIVMCMHNQLRNQKTSLQLQNYIHQVPYTVVWEKFGMKKFSSDATYNKN